MCAAKINSSSELRVSAWPAHFKTACTKLASLKGALKHLLNVVRKCCQYVKEAPVNLRAKYYYCKQRIYNLG